MICLPKSYFALKLHFVSSSSGLIAPQGLTFTDDGSLFVTIRSIPGADAYLALQNVAKKWTMPIKDWRAALNRFAIAFEDRLPI